MSLRERDGAAGRALGPSVPRHARPARRRERPARRQPARRPGAPSAVGLPAAGRRARPSQAAPVRLRDPGLHGPARHVGEPRRRSSRRSSSASTTCSRAATAPTRSSCWSTRGRATAARSSSTRPRPGRTCRYLCDEVVPFVDERYPTLAHRDHRGLTGKSSGGYGAMVVPMLRPDVFGALASHCGDALFEVCYATTSRRRRASCATTSTAPTSASSSELAAADHVDFDRFAEPLEAYGYAACYSPDPAAPGKALLPFEIETGRRIDDVWQQWLDWDPVRLAPAHADALRSMKRIYLDAGKRDEYYLDLGATAFARGGREGRRDVHARAVRRHARRAHVPLPGRDPRARDRARAVAPGLGGRPRPEAGLGVDVAGAGEHVHAIPSGGAVELGGAFGAVRVVVARRRAASRPPPRRRARRRAGRGRTSGSAPARRRATAARRAARARRGRPPPRARAVVQPEDAGERVRDDRRLAARSSCASAARQAGSDGACGSGRSG